jgi:GNAT superfamily N-acetyltransferase
MTTLKIRKAERNDIPAIFALVKELAEYEKAPEAVITSEKIYLEDFTNAVFDAHVAELNGEIIGMALYYLAYSTWKGKMLYLEDFVVKSAHRRTGAGQLLFDAYLEEAKNRNCSMVKWQVLDWNEPAIQFYEKLGAIVDKDWYTCKMNF